MKILATILLLGILAFPIDRPYMHVAVYARECRAEWCPPPIKRLYDVPTLQEAMKKFHADYPEYEVLCVARDFFAQCQF